MKQTLFFLSLSILLTATACKGPRGANGSTLKKRSADYLMKQLIQNQVKAETFSGRAKVKYRGEDSSITVSSSIKIRKDSAIWLNAKAFGLEAGRALIRPDSVFILDRINKQYYAKSFEWLRREYGVPVNYEGLQAMLLGNPVFLTNDLEVSSDSLNYYLEGENDRFMMKYGIHGANFQLLSMLIDEKGKPERGAIELTDYRPLPDGQNFSYIRRIFFDSPDTGATEVGIEFSKITINEATKIGFSIPPTYTRVE